MICGPALAPVMARRIAARARPRSGGPAVFVGGKRVGFKLLVTPGDLKIQQGVVRSKVEEVNGLLGQLLTQGKIRVNDPLWTQWGSFRERANKYLAWEPGWMGWFDPQLATWWDEGEQIQRDLTPWYDRINALGGHVVVPKAPPAGRGLLPDLLGADIGPLIALALFFALKDRH